MTRIRLLKLHLMFGNRSGSDQEQTDQGPPAGALTSPPLSPEQSAPSPAQPTGTIPASTISPYADPGLPQLEGEDSTVDFHAAFEVVIEVEPGARIADPLSQLDPKERADYRGELEDVIDAQRYGRSLGSVSRR